MDSKNSTSNQMSGHPDKRKKSAISGLLEAVAETDVAKAATEAERREKEAAQEFLV
jgi:hypothetical protein